MDNENSPKKSNLARALIVFLIIAVAQIIGRTAAGGELDQPFLVQAIITAVIVTAIFYGAVWMGRSIRSGKRK